MKRVFFLSLPIMFLSCLISMLASGQDSGNSIDTGWIYKTIDSAMKANNIPAISIGIVQDGKLAYVKGFGNLTRESTVKVDENSLFQIGSDTKKFTAIIVNNLVAEGKLQLEEPITTYLQKELTDESKKRLIGVTLENLLLHKSGIPYRELTNRRVDGEAMTIPYTEEDILKDLNSVKLDTLPNTKFNYSNFGYAIAGYICEKVSGKDYSVLAKKYVTDKYNMPNTVIYPTKKQSKWIAWPYRKDNRTIKSTPWTMGKMTPAGGVYSNVKDISNLMLAQLKAYQHLNENKDNPLILTEKSDSARAHYGFGLSKGIDENGVRYGHGGDLDGYASDYVFMPQENVGLILFTSSGGRWFGQLARQIKPVLWHKKMY